MPSAAAGERQRSCIEVINRKRKKKKRKVEEYREISACLIGYPDEDVRKARRLVSTFKLSSEQLKKW